MDGEVNDVPLMPDYLEFIKWLKWSPVGGNFMFLAKDTRVRDGNSVQAKVVVKGIVLDLLRNHKTGECTLGGAEFKNEILLWREMWHRHIVTFREVFLQKGSSKDGYVGVTMNYIPGGTLERRVEEKGKLDEDTARTFFQQIILVIDYLHNTLNIMHRKITPENLLLDDMVLYLHDFGWSKRRGGRMTATPYTTPSYTVAPEVFATIYNKKRYDGKASDIWSCGVCLYYMVFGKCPRRRYYVPGDEVEIPSGVSEPCRQLLGRLLETDPTCRASLKEIKENKWFQEELPEFSYNDNVMSDPGRYEEMKRRQSETELMDIFRFERKNRGGRSH